MVGKASAHWARRRTESCHLSEADRLDVLATYNRLKQNVSATARNRNVSRTTVRRVVEELTTTGAAASPYRHNSGRPRTAISAATVAKVGAAMMAPGEGQYVPSASSVARKLPLGVSTQSVRRAAKEAGLGSREAASYRLVDRKQEAPSPAGEGYD